MPLPNPMTTSTTKIATTVSQPQFAAIFLLGFSSGLPFLLILSTLSVWLTEVGISKTQIGILAWVTVPYTVKFLWAPFIDSFKLPILYQLLGQRRSWLLLAQIMLLLSILALAAANPSTNIFYTALSALLVGFFSAIQDIVVEAYRIETCSDQRCGVGASFSVLGYRCGMLCSGAGAIYASALFNSWSVAYNIIAVLVLVGIATTLLIKEPVAQVKRYHPSATVQTWLHNVLISPLKSFVLQREWWIIIPFIMFYKIADTILNVMSMPFLLEIGFNKIEIAHAAKSFGIMAMIIGGMAGGILLARATLRAILMLSLWLQLLASSLFVMQAVLGDDLAILFVTMGIENFSCGLAQVALITYLSKLCSQPHTAVHYAILSSFASLVRVNFSMLSGWVADHLAWEHFYSLVGLSCLPGLAIIVYCARHFSFAEDEQITENAGGLSAA